MTAAEYKHERKRRGLTQAALAALVGVRQGTVSDRETERIGISREAALAILSLPVPPRKGQNVQEMAGEALPSSTCSPPVVLAGDLVMSRRSGVPSSPGPISFGVRNWITLPDTLQRDCKSPDHDP